MPSEDTTRSSQGRTPTDSQRGPSDRNHSNPDVKMEDSPKDNHPNSSQDNPERTSEEPGWRGRLAKIRYFFARPADFWVALFTFVLAFETAISLRILSKTDEALHTTAAAQEKATEIADRMREITEDNERAWVGPNDARIFDNKEIDKPLKVTVSVMNSGRQPALTNTYMALKRYSAKDWQSDDYKTDVFAWQTSCFGRNFSDKLATRQIFPGFIPGSNTYSLTASSDKAAQPFVVTEELTRGGDVTVALGCFVYEAFKITRRTMFCYYHDKGRDENHLTFCPVGQYAN